MPKRDPNSPWYSTPADKRHRKPVNLSLPTETIDALDAIAAETGHSRSQVVERLVEREIRKKKYEGA